MNLSDVRPDFKSDIFECLRLRFDIWCRKWGYSWIMFYETRRFI